MTQKQIKLDDYFLKRTEQYVHPNNFTGYSSGLYKITINTNGHVTNAQSVSGEDLPSHNHSINNITNLQSTLNAKLESSDLVDELNDIVLDLINEGGS